MNRWIGSTTRHDLTNSYGLVIIPRGTMLTDEKIKLIIKHQIPIKESDLDLPLVDLHETASNEKLVTRAAEEIRDILGKIRSDGIVPMEDIRANLLPQIHQAVEFPTLHSVLSGLQAKDDYTYRHNIGVGVISTMIGKWLKIKGEELSLLTIAATLHDAGKIKIPDAILNKPGKYTDEEYAVMKRHALYGYEILVQSPGLDPRIPIVALQHHEREDGKGYPYGITGEKMDFFSKIVAVADVFHAMTSKRVYKNASPFYQVMDQMHRDGFGKLDPSICSMFVQRMMAMTVGNQVQLTDGRIAQVLMIHTDDPAHPLVRVGSGYIDLRKEPNLHLEKLVN